MNEHPINDLMSITLEKIRAVLDANTIVGEPIVTQDGLTLIPVSKLSLGFASGGSDFGGKAPQTSSNFGGGSGAGISLTPVAFLVVKDGNVRMIPVNNPNNTADRIVELVPEMFDKVSDLFNKKRED